MIPAFAQPHLAPEAGFVVPGAGMPGGRFDPPPGFRPVGVVSDAHFFDRSLNSVLRSGPGQSIERERAVASGVSPRPPAADPGGLSPAQAAGLRFQARVSESLLDRFPGRAVPAAWLLFRDNWRTRRCEPDVLLLLDDRVVVIEIKSSHTILAWWQLRRLYQPVLRTMTNKPVQVLELCHLFDPQLTFPEPITLRDGPEDLTQLDDSYNVLCWKP